MAINLATNYSSIIDEAFKLGALSNPGVNDNYSFVDANVVKVYNLSTSAMNDYVRSGDNRFGIPSELQDTVQTLTLSQAKSFTFTIDKLNAIDSPAGIRDAGAALARQIKQVAIPMVDAYRFAKMASGAGTADYTAITSSNAYSKFLDAQAILNDKEVPTEGRIAFCSSAFYNLLKLDANFIKASDLAMKDIAIKGVVGMVDGVYIIPVPAPRLSAGVSFIISHPVACPAPVKLEEYRVLDNQRGIAGFVVEGLIYHDCFILDHKKDAIYTEFGKLEALTATSTAGAATKSVLAVTAGKIDGATLYWKGHATAVTPPALGGDLSGWTEVPADGIITPTSTFTKVVVAAGINSKAVGTSAEITLNIGS